MTACAWSPDGRRLLSGSVDSTLRLWDAETGVCLRTLYGHANWVMACAWSPDGRRLLSGSLDSTLRLWDAETGACLRTLSGHAKAVWACAWSPDGRRLLSGSLDSTLKAWDPDSGEVLFTAHLLPEDATATFAGDELTHTRGEAWRWLGFRWRDPRTGRDRLLPAEHFGPLPH
jgi:WD40 repeat protein